MYTFKVNTCVYSKYERKYSILVKCPHTYATIHYTIHILYTYTISLTKYRQSPSIKRTNKQQYRYKESHGWKYMFIYIPIYSDFIQATGNS